MSLNTLNDKGENIMINIEELTEKEIYYGKVAEQFAIETKDILVMIPVDSYYIDAFSVFGNKNIVSDIILDIPMREIVVKDKSIERNVPDDYSNNDLYSLYDYGQQLRLCRPESENAYIEILGKHKQPLLKAVLGLDENIQY